MDWKINEKMNTSDLEQWIVELKELKIQRIAELKQFKEMGQYDLCHYITGKCDELDLMIGKVYEVLYKSIKSSKN
jgi:hypothetical protein